MQELYNALMNGEAIYKDGVMIGQHPPTALAMRAARTLKQLSDINDTNAILIRQLQSREQDWLRSMEINETKIDQLTAQLAQIIKRGDSVDEIVQNLENPPPVVEESQGSVESAPTQVEESAANTSAADKTPHNMFK